MILRRFMKHVSDQNWFAVGLDVLVVITGIFLGMQVTEWNERQKDRAEEALYLERLLQDMNGAIEDFYRNLSFDIDRLETQQMILDRLRSGHLDEKDYQDFEAGLAYIGIHNPIFRRWGTVDELKATGKIALIQDVALREHIATVEATYERHAYIIEESVQRNVRLRNQLIRHFDIQSFAYSRENTVAVVQYDFDELANNQEFINMLAGLQLDSDMLVTFMVGYAREVAALRDRLAEILGKDKSELVKVNMFWKDLHDRPLPSAKRPLNKIIERLEQYQ